MQLLMFQKAWYNAGAAQVIVHIMHKVTGDQTLRERNVIESEKKIKYIMPECHHSFAFGAFE